LVFDFARELVTFEADFDAAAVFDAETTIADLDLMLFAVLDALGHVDGPTEQDLEALGHVDGPREPDLDALGQVEGPTDALGQEEGPGLEAEEHLDVPTEAEGHEAGLLELALDFFDLDFAYFLLSLLFLDWADIGLLSEALFFPEALTVKLAFVGVAEPI